MHKLSLRAVKSMGKRPTTTPMMTMSSRRVAAAAAFAVSATVIPDGRLPSQRAGGPEHPSSRLRHDRSRTRALPLENALCREKPPAHVVRCCRH